MDNLTPTQRRRAMSNVPSKDTSLERMVRSALHQRGLRFRKHVSDLPGSPDIVFARARVAVFIDGDFWHGYRLPAWQDKLTPYWREKIERNRRRDVRNHRRLRRMGWKVVRIWGHDVRRDLDGVVLRISLVVDRFPHEESR